MALAPRTVSRLPLRREANRPDAPGPAIAGGRPAICPGRAVVAALRNGKPTGARDKPALCNGAVCLPERSGRLTANLNPGAGRPGRAARAPRPLMPFCGRAEEAHAGRPQHRRGLGLRRWVVLFFLFSLSFLKKKREAERGAVLLGTYCHPSPKTT